MLTQMKVLYVAHSVRLAVRRPCRTLDEHYAASCCTMLACVNRLFVKGGCVIQPPYYYVLLAVKASRRKSRTLRIGLSPLPFLWTAVAGSIIIIVSVRNSYSSFLCYLACVSLSAGLLHSPYLRSSALCIRSLPYVSLHSSSWTISIIFAASSSCFQGLLRFFRYS